MNFLKRSGIAAVVLGAIVAVTGTPAAAIVGGRDATQGYSGMASLTQQLPDGRKGSCGASLVSPTMALTAAHCVADRDAAPNPIAVPAERLTLRIGSNDRTSGGVVVGVTQVFLNPGWAWGEPTGDAMSDLALLKLATPVWSALMPISDRQVRQADLVRLIGWGLTVYPPPPGTTIPVILQERDTTRLAASVCADGGIGAGEICVGSGGCFGDSGGPALRPLYASPGGEQRWAQIGITSRGATGAPACDVPGVWTDPTYLPFRIWIITTILHPVPQKPKYPCTCPPSPARAAAKARIDQFWPQQWELAA